MRFVTLITLRDNSGAERFVYGNALPDRRDLGEAREWRALQHQLGENIRLARYTSVLGDHAFTDLHSALLHGTVLRLPLTGGMEALVLPRPNMVERGVVRASRADFERLTPLVEHRAYGSL
jgi:hypothetical protein